MEKDLEGKYIPVKYSKKNGITGCFASLEELGRISRMQQPKQEYLHFLLLLHYSVV